MTTVKFKGGLGNQMFQYATGLAVTLHNNDELALDISGYKHQFTKDTPRKFELSVFNISQNDFHTRKTSSLHRFLKRVKNKLLPRDPYAFDPSVFALENLDGFFSNEKYFIDIRERILKEFTLKNETSDFIETKKYIESIPSISLHVRRGDYVSNPHAHTVHGVSPLSYYQKAYDTLVKKIGIDFTLFIFTDDIDWATQHINFHSQTYLMSNQNFIGAEELILMSHCTHNIISNSSFSWWGAWLNQNPEKIVIAPHQWTTLKTSEELDILPPLWIQV